MFGRTGIEGLPPSAANSPRDALKTKKADAKSQCEIKNLHALHGALLCVLKTLPWMV